MRLFISVGRGLLVFALAATTFWATAQGSSANGLTATFYPSRSLTRPLLTRVDPTIDFRWDNQAPGPGLPATDYAVRWTGWLLPPATGEYTFVLDADDGLRVWVDEKLILDEWHLQEPTQYRRRVALMAGRAVALRVEYFQEQYEARAQVRWFLPGTEPAPVAARPGLQAPAPQQIAPTYLFQQNPTPEPTPPPVMAAPAPAPDSVAAPMPPLTSGAQFALPNVYFETAKARLLPRSARTLDGLAAALLAQPALQIQISGHTDIVGDPDLNQRLSEARAERVLDYLVMRGVPAERLAAVGYGSTKPVARNNSAAERARNRRVEVMVR